MQPVANPTVSLPEVNPNRRSPFRNPASPTEEESLCALICALAGSHFQGILKAAPEVGLEAHVLFSDANGSTLALPVKTITAEKVRQHIRASNFKWRKNV